MDLVQEEEGEGWERQVPGRGGGGRRPGEGRLCGKTGK